MARENYTRTKQQRNRGAFLFGEALDSFRCRPIARDYSGMKTRCALARLMPISSELHEDDIGMVKEVEVTNGVAVGGR